MGDVALANLMALTAGGGQVINVSCGQEVSVNELLRVMQEVTGLEAEVIRAPERPGEIRRSALSNRRAQAVLGWRPTLTLREGLQRVYDYEKISI